MSENKKGPSVGFKIFVWVLSAVIIVGVAIGGVSLMKKAGDALDVLTSDVSSNTESDIPDNSAQDNPGTSEDDSELETPGTSEDDSAQETPGTSEDDSEPETPEVEEPEPVVPLVNYEMSVREINFGVANNRPKLNVQLLFTQELYADILLFGKVYVLWAPLSYFQAVNPNNEPTCDYVKKFKEQYHTDYQLNEVQFSDEQIVDNDDGRLKVNVAKAALYNIPYNKVNTKYVAMAVLSYGGDTYEYGTFEEGSYAHSANSVGLLCAHHVNLVHYYETLGLDPHISDSMYSHCRYFLSEAVDLRAGLAGPTENYNTYELGYEGKTLTMKVGETIKLDTSLTPSATLSDTIIWLRPLVKKSGSSDVYEYSHGIVEVDNQGNVKAIGKGTVCVAIFAGGDMAAVWITVS